MAPTIQMTAALRLVTTPELRFSSKGNAWATFRGVVNERVRGDDGTWGDGPATFVNVLVLTAKMAENLAEADLQTGDNVLVTGVFRQREYEKDGEKKQAYDLVADELGLSLRWRTATVNRDAAAAARAAEPAQEPVPQDDEPPF